MRLFVLLVLAPVTALLLASALLVIAPGPIAERILWLGLALPLIWVAIMVLAYRTSAPWRLAGGLGAVAGLSAAAVALLPPPG